MATDELTGLAERRVLQKVVDDLLQKGSIRALEAGCGSFAHVNLGSDVFLVGLDVSEVALERNQVLDEKILGDVETYEFPEDSFDVIVCWYVFEHLPHPDQAMKRFAHALRPGGLLVLALPNVLSIKGLATKFTPFRFHVWVRRRLLGRPLAGTPGHAPYPTFLPLSLAPTKLQASAADLGLTVRYFAMFEDPKQETIRRKFRVTGKVWDLIRKLTKVLTRARLATDQTECLFVFQAARTHQ